MHHIDVEALRRVYNRQRRNASAGADGVTVEAYGENLEANLKRLCDRVHSGSYRPRPVRRAYVPKADGALRPIGIPVLEDKIVQGAVSEVLSAIYEVDFLGFSYGFRPGRSPHHALQSLNAALIKRKINWVLDADVRRFFDSVDHEWLLRMVARRIADPRILRLIKQWLRAGVLEGDKWFKTLEGTPQGGVISPLLANIFLHHAFDEWMRVNHPSTPFARYADDIIVHCHTEAQARVMLRVIERRLARCKLQLHPEKTKIVYCKDAKRPGSHEHESFNFLGYSFRPHDCRGRNYLVGFNPAVSKSALKAMSATIRSWKLQLWSSSSLEDVARRINPVIRGWLNYYGRYYKSAMRPILRQLQYALVRWAMRKYKRLRGHWLKATHWLGCIARRDPRLIASWEFGYRPSAGQ